MDISNHDDNRHNQVFENTSSLDHILQKTDGIHEKMSVK